MRYLSVGRPEKGLTKLIAPAMRAGGAVSLGPFPLFGAAGMVIFFGWGALRGNGRLKLGYGCSSEATVSVNWGGLVFRGNGRLEHEGLVS